MEFADFLQDEEEDNLISEALVDEGLWDVGAGLLGAAGGALTVGDEAIAKAMGQGTRGRMGGGASNVTGGLHLALFGKPQKEPAPAQLGAEDIQAVAREFERLKRAYKQAESMGDRNLMRQVRARMYRVDPASYTDLVNKSHAKRKEVERRRWAAASSASAPERPEDFLGRLATES